MAAQLMCGMMYLHGARVVHLDVKCSNVLVMRKGIACVHVKIADMGLSRRLGADGYVCLAGDSSFTLPYRPVELVVASKQLCKFGTETDVWAIGVCMYDLFAVSGSFMLFASFDFQKWAGQPVAQALAAFRAAASARLLQRSVHTEASKIVLRCVERNTARATVAQLYNAVQNHLEQL